MSKGPGAKDNSDARRRRRGGLRVPSDNVPRQSSQENEIAAPVPEAMGLAASVSESFGVAAVPAVDPELERELHDSMDDSLDDNLDQDTPSDDSLDEEMATVVNDPAIPRRARFDTEAESSAAASGDVSSAAVNLDAVPIATDAAQTEGMDAVPIAAERAGTDEINDSMLTGEVQSIDDVPPELKPASDTESMLLVHDGGEGDTGESVDIPFEEESDPLAAAPAPNPPSIQHGAAAGKSGPTPATQAVAPGAQTGGLPGGLHEGLPPSEADTAPLMPTAAIVGQGAGGKARRPRFARAHTMALNESDLEEVQLEMSQGDISGGEFSSGEFSSGEFSSGEGAHAAPHAPASPVDSGDVIDDDELEEIPADMPEPLAKEDDTHVPLATDAPVASVPSVDSAKKTEGGEPPPPPPPKPAKPAKPAPSVSDDKKRRRSKPWFEEIFDEDYLRTLPFLTPKATQFEANFVMESLGVETGAQILDVGCGYGRHAMELAARGYHVVGLDSSLPLLLRGADEAQRRGLTINFVHGDMREMSFESQFDGAYCLFSSFGYFDDETNKRTAQNIAKALKPGARFVVEVLNRDYLVADLPSRVWWEGDGCVVLEEVEFNYFSSRIVSNRLVVFDDGRQLEHEISLRSFSLHELGKFLHAVGFRVLEISGSMSTRGRFFGAHSRDIVVVAEKRALKSEES